MKIFLDTNALVSALTARGLCAELFEVVLNEHELLLSAQVLKELKETLEKKFRMPANIVRDFIALLKTEGKLLDAGEIPDIALAAPDDLPILAAALAGESDLFVTGDKAILKLKKIAGMPLRSPREAWIMLTTSAPTP